VGDAQLHRLGRSPARHRPGRHAAAPHRHQLSPPNIGKYGRNLQFGAEVEDFETDAFDQTGANISATIEEQLTPRLRASLGVEAGFASILDQTARIAGAGRRDVYILSASGTAEYIGVRDILDPRTAFAPASPSSRATPSATPTSSLDASAAKRDLLRLRHRRISSAPCAAARHHHRPQWRAA
jgi:hypothetical protein